jgi:hypothetical protein
MKLYAKRDLRVAFGDYVLATPAVTENSMLPRAEPCVTLGGKINHTESVWMLSLRTGKIVTRDQFVIQPMPDIVIDKLTEQAARQEYTRSADPTLEFPNVLKNELNNSLLPEMMDIDGRVDKTFDGPGMVDLVGEDTFKASQSAKVQALWVLAQAQVEGTSASRSPAHVSPEKSVDTHQVHRGVRWPQRILARAMSDMLLSRHITNAYGSVIKRKMVAQSDCKNCRDFAFKISVSAALRDRGDEARPVIMAEFYQMVAKGVWHGIHLTDLNSLERKT